ncbi:hypothetical protein CERZMDRAFT_106229 [Cercospora zeae-maydis SCOH1-5]|uniref:J domain-containing protein n=1 Tax=Cercospora zeae-maydis SCOH1-5 TaxID=717836 RepID=A0A6A6FEP2_9PEZI|nr:hypothetical protein CERZMDRAFT_106229 [Cercospora zeae-maydis SCOH1-5]
MVLINRSCSALLATTHSFSSISISSTSLSRGQRAGTRPAACRAGGYATIAGDARDIGDQSEGRQWEHKWPEAPKGQRHPTPYQIFDMKHDAKYSKTAYYKLVKLYHPDLQVNSVGSTRGNLEVSNASKMERYRLIVAAHTILSDPVKRSAYDRFGAGWNGKAEVGDRTTWAQPSPFHPAGPFSQSWHDPSDPVWQNATWEDWERYHDNKAYPMKKAPVYMKNSYFLAVVVALAIMGSSLNLQRAQDNGTYIVEARDMVHDQASKNLRQVRKEMQGLSNRQDRIDFFMRQREASMGGSVGDHQALRDERASRLLKDQEICSSEEVKERGT